MKVICQILASVALFGIVLCTGEDGEVGIETQGGGDRECGIPLESGETEENLPGIVEQMTFNCWRSHYKALDDKIDRNSTTEQVRDIFKEFCERAPVFNNCSDNVPVQAQGCVDENLLEVVKVDREALQKLLRVGCKEDGERLITIFQEGAKLWNDPQVFTEVDKCFISVRIYAEDFITKVNANATERSVVINRGINEFKECCLALPEQASVVSQALVSIMDDMLA